MKNKAYTIIEIAFVTIILAMLSCFVIPNIIKTLDNGKKADLCTKLRAMYVLQDRYYQDNDKYLEAGEELSACYFAINPKGGIESCVAGYGGANNIIANIGDGDVFTCHNNACMASSSKIKAIVLLDMPLNENNPKLRWHMTETKVRHKIIINADAERDFNKIYVFEDDEPGIITQEEVERWDGTHLTHTAKLVSNNSQGW